MILVISFGRLTAVAIFDNSFVDLFSEWLTMNKFER